MHGIPQIRLVTADRAEEVADLYALVRAHIHVHLVSGAHLRVEVLAHDDSPRNLVAGWQVTVKADRAVEGKHLLLCKRNRRVSRVDTVAGVLDLRDRCFAPR